MEGRLPVLSEMGRAGGPLPFEHSLREEYVGREDHMYAKILRQE